MSATRLTTPRAAAIAGVLVRDHLGDAEDTIFATVFFGSGLLFLSTVLVVSIAGGILDVSRTPDSSGLVPTGEVEIVSFGRAVMATYLLAVRD